MKIYIAAPWQYRSHAILLMTKLVEKGHEVTSSWLVVDDDSADGLPTSLEGADKYARADLNDVEAADMLVAINPKEFANAGTGGRHVELGYAIARGKQIVLFGERSNIFHSLSNIRLITSLEDL